jgi:ATP-dependent DNA ligase
MEDQTMLTYTYPNQPNYISPDLIGEYDKKPDWIGEKKKNGWRCLAIKEGDKLTLWTSSRHLFQDALPKTRAALMGLTNSILDGELIDKRTKNTKDEFYAFDILAFEGALLYGKPWKERRALLELATRDIEGITIAEPISTGKSLLYEIAVEEGDEGIVMKQIHSKYLIFTKERGTNPFWIKAKRPEAAFKMEDYEHN